MAADFEDGSFYPDRIQDMNTKDIIKQFIKGSDPVNRIIGRAVLYQRALKELVNAPIRKNPYLEPPDDMMCYWCGGEEDCHIEECPSYIAHAALDADFDMSDEENKDLVDVISLLNEELEVAMAAYVDLLGIQGRYEALLEVENAAWNAVELCSLPDSALKNYVNDILRHTLEIASS